jgi:uncharacterized protein YndB with AHSA1/START domain
LKVAHDHLDDPSRFWEGPLLSNLHPGLDLEETAVSKRIDRAERHIDATAADVYAAFVDREHVLKWLPPEGARAELERFEPRPGGAFEMRLIFDSATGGKSDADSDVVRGTFEKLVPAASITQRFRFESDDPRFAGTMTISWRFAPNERGTLVSVEAAHVPQGISPTDHKRGMESSLANLARLVERRWS